MERLSITTHLIAVLTAFSAFTMPIALEVLNRVKTRYGSAYYMDAIEQKMGFKIQFLFRELILTLITLIWFSLYVSSVDKNTFSDNYVSFFETVFLLITSTLLIKEFRFIQIVFLATRSDSLVTEHLISKLSKTDSSNASHAIEIELLVQIASFNIGNSTSHFETPTEQKLFKLIENAYTNQSNSISHVTIKKLLGELAVTLTSARSTGSRDKYVFLQRDYGKHLVLFFDRKIKNYDVFERFSTNLYEESIKELNSDQYWLLRADFLIGVHTWDIQSPQTILFIDRHVRSLIDFLVDKKPELLPELIDNYRNFVSYESYFSDEIYQLSSLFGDNNYEHFDEVSSFTEIHKELLNNNPQEYINKFLLLLDKYTQDALASDVSAVRYQEVKEIASEFEKNMVEEIIKAVGAQTAKRTAQYTLRALAQNDQWRCILDCHESFNPANSKAMHLGINLLPASLNSVIQQLGRPHGYSSLNSEELGIAYIRALPILVMYALYCWRIQNLDKELNTGIETITSSINMGEKTIQITKRMLSELKQSMYYAQSPTYAEVFCSHFDIRHEEAAFNNSVIPILHKVVKYLEEQLIELRNTQPLSEQIKQNHIDKILMKGTDLATKFPLLSYVSLCKQKQDPIKFPPITHSREEFLDNTGVGYGLSNRRIIENIHNQIALQQITTGGSPICDLNLNDIKDNHTIIISHKDWQALRESSCADKIRNINRHLVHSNTLLDAFYLHDTSSCNPIAKLHSQNNDGVTRLTCDHIDNAFEFNFKDEGGAVAIEIDAHIYF
ncbi:hypothetical protein LRP52_37370 [Photobacterium sp. ZSDE20]|uniref:Uncharacterized protein n=1 Tax=Photobacterium pectinilyticum TaxID=2906793 RepID=A0ABT1N3D9_9GAMM|nr:hypothetical protein [Photobacterium sp. ZSDE20]MCQ1058364.1 hypothetical protein [Photobacterium sp. ZSDE20]MDD1827859.1 hypothetical protein [Photobacterium sp. ZSDE20]